MSEHKESELQVIPRDVGAYPGLTGAFEILHFPLEQDPGVVARPEMAGPRRMVTVLRNLPSTRADSGCR
jgi:hypothetical protein